MTGKRSEGQFQNREEPLLPDTDRAHDRASHGSMGNALETEQTEQGAETQENTGIIQGDPTKRI